MPMRAKTRWDALVVVCLNAVMVVRVVVMEIAVVAAWGVPVLVLGDVMVVLVNVGKVVRVLASHVLVFVLEVGRFCSYY